MKRHLLIVRHATAEDGSFYLPDFNRELTPEGTIEAARMGNFLKKNQTKLDFVVSSSAVRASQTAKVIAEQLSFGESDIVLEPNLYDGGPKAYLSAVNNAPVGAQTVMLVGHNPDISFFAEYLTYDEIGSMKKGAVAIIEFDGFEWSEVSGRTGKLLNYDTPKSIL